MKSKFDGLDEERKIKPSVRCLLDVAAARTTGNVAPAVCIKIAGPTPIYSAPTEGVVVSAAKCI